MRRVCWTSMVAHRCAGDPDCRDHPGGAGTTRNRGIGAEHDRAWKTCRCSGPTWRMPVGGLFCRGGHPGQPARPAAPGTGDRAMTATVMLITMVLCFALTISVAVSIGLAVAGWASRSANVNMLISVKEMFSFHQQISVGRHSLFHPGRQPDGNRRHQSRRLVEFAKSLVGGVQGGLPMTCVLTCMIFAAVSGSSRGHHLRHWRHPDTGAHQGTATPPPGRRRCRPPAPSWASSSLRPSR